MPGKSVQAYDKLFVMSPGAPQFSKEDLDIYKAAGYELGVVPAGFGGIGSGVYCGRDFETPDWTLASFTRDGEAHELSLLPVVPAGAKYAFIRIEGHTVNAVGEMGAIQPSDGSIVNGAVFGGIGTYDLDVCVLFSLGAGPKVQYAIQAGAWLVTLNVGVNGWIM